MNSSIRSRFNAITNSLRWARKILAVAAIVQIPLLIALLMHKVLPQQVAGFSWFAGAMLSWLGFSMVNRQLAIYHDALSSLPGFVVDSAYMRTRLALIFYFVLLAPMINLLVIAWCYSEAGAGIRNAAEAYKQIVEEEKRAARLRGGPAQAFRTGQ